jgi:predicted nucleic acid-binding protein
MRHIFLRALEILRFNRVEIVQMDESLLERATLLFRDRPDKDWSLVDCISFVVMSERDIKCAAATDLHFEQAQFEAILRRSAGQR